MHNDDIFLGFFGGFFATVAIVLIIEVIVAYLLHQGLQKIPEKYRATEPYMAWLTLIPIAGIAFYWILLPFKIPESFRSYFAENPGNGKEPQDYGKNKGLGVTISTTCMCIPVINLVAWIPAIVFLIQYLQQFMEMQRQLPVSPANRFPAGNAYTSVASTDYDKFTQLEKLKQLLDQDILTADEYQHEKRKILKDPP